MQLPETIQHFFEGENAGDFDGVAACFAAEATVKDEGGTHRGPAEIRQWMADAKAKYQHTAEPRAVEARDGWTVVIAEVAGQFPGSPIQLPHAFRLDGGKIAALEIG